MTGTTADQKYSPKRHFSRAHPSPTGPESGAGGRTEPSAEEMRAELARVVASSAFATSPQLSGFLKYLVEEFLAGRGDGIKERNIGVHALGRPVEFDPRQDSVVRVTAVRLRRALQEYYAAEGAADPLRIEIPKGAYLPLFERQDAESADDDGGAGAAVARKADSSRQSGGWLSRPTPLWLVGILVVVAATAGLVAAFRGASTTHVVEQTGALPYRIKEGRLEVLIVRTRRDSHWTVPKATQDADRTRGEVAEGEAWEEAGVEGSAGPSAIGDYEYIRGETVYRVTVYPVLVTEVHDSWPEDSRDRLWCAPRAEPVPVESDQLRMIITDFVPGSL